MGSDNFEKLLICCLADILVGRELIEDEEDFRHYLKIIRNYETVYECEFFSTDTLDIDHCDVTVSDLLEYMAVGRGFLNQSEGGV